MVQNLEDITVTQTCQTQQQQQKQQQQQWLSEDSHYPQLNHWPKLVKIVTASLLPRLPQPILEAWTHVGWSNCVGVTLTHIIIIHPSIIMRVCRLNHGHLFRYDWVTGRPIWPTFQLPRHTLMPVV